MVPRIFTVSERSAKYRIKILIEKFIGFKHHTFSGRRECPAKLAEMSDFLLQLCDLSPANLYQLLKNTSKLNKEWESDWLFYLNMCEATQVGRIAGVDIKLAGKENEKQSKEENKTKQKVKSDAHKRKMLEKVSGEDFDNGPVGKQSDELDDEVVFQPKKKKSRTDKIFLEIDPKKIIAQTANTSDRLGLSARQTAMMLAAVVKAGGEDVAKVALSKSAVHVQRKKARCIKERR